LDTQVARLLERGAAAVTNANGKAGRYLVHLERKLLAEMKEPPTEAQRRLLIGYCRRQYQLEQFEKRLFREKQPATTDLRLYSQLCNQQLRVHRALFGGISDEQPEPEYTQPAPLPSLADIAAGM
jgi:hypothetical protein